VTKANIVIECPEGKERNGDSFSIKWTLLKTTKGRASKNIPFKYSVRNVDTNINEHL
jgi:hypothetical protein